MFKPRVLLFYAVALLAGESRAGELETVNAAPQLSVDEDQFSFYWGVWWRPDSNPDSGEAQALHSTGKGSALLSRRSISWTVRACEDDQALNEASETFWYLDELRLDRDGKLRPIPEAPRPGYLYLSVGTVNGLHLRGLGPFVAPQRQRGEAAHAYRARVAAAYKAWSAVAGPRGSSGEINFESTLRVYTSKDSDGWGYFVRFEDYRAVNEGSDLARQFLPYRADRWPVYHDERAHKPHTLEEPSIWRSDTFVSESQLQLRLSWNWCDISAPPKIVACVPQGGLPPPGPSRPGRPEGGNSDLAYLFGDCEDPIR